MRRSDRTRFRLSARSVLAVIAASALQASLAGAHALAPSLLSLREEAPGHVEVEWKTPAVGIPGNDLQPVLPAQCTTASAPSIERLETSFVGRWRIECPPSGLVGLTIGATGIASSRADVVLRVALADGRSFHALLGPEEPSFTVPERQSWTSVTNGYLRLGVEHIALGADHLLFVLGLVLLIRGTGVLVRTLTAFTLGHSVTLSLAVLDLVHVPQAIAEAGIATSLFVLAVELAGPEGESRSPMRRRPELVAVFFGLLHGLGFAGALAEIGVPPGDVPLALASFNLGIEVGQILFVIVVLAARRVLLRLPLHWPARVERLPAYSIGSLAAFWLFERALPLGF